MRVAYRADPAVTITVNLIRSWERGEIQEMAMSGSSGPKDYTRNHIFSIFERYPRVMRVLMVRGEYSQIGADKRLSAPFLLVLDGFGRYFDMAGKEVVIEP